MTWTKQPPKEPGLYWHRVEQSGKMHVDVVSLEASGSVWMIGSEIDELIEDFKGEWWDQRLAEPPP